MRANKEKPTPNESEKEHKQPIDNFHLPIFHFAMRNKKPYRKRRERIREKKMEIDWGIETHAILSGLSASTVVHLSTCWNRMNDVIYTSGSLDYYGHHVSMRCILWISRLDACYFWGYFIAYNRTEVRIFSFTLIFGGQRFHSLSLYLTQSFLHHVYVCEKRFLSVRATATGLYSGKLSSRKDSR